MRTGSISAARARPPPASARKGDGVRAMFPLPPCSLALRLAAQRTRFPRAVENRAGSRALEPWLPGPTDLGALVTSLLVACPTDLGSENLAPGAFAGPPIQWTPPSKHRALPDVAPWLLKIHRSASCCPDATACGSTVPYAKEARRLCRGLASLWERPPVAPKYTYSLTPSTTVL